MELIKRLLVGFCLITICWAASSEPKTALIVETKGGATTFFGGKTSPVRTLQVLPETSKVTVPAKSRVRLVYLASGRKETAIGPLSFTLSKDGAIEVSGTGKLETGRADGANTLIPRDENLRRMGGAVQAQAEKSPLELLDIVAMAPPAAVPRSGAISSGLTASDNAAPSSLVRSSRPIICNVSPVFRWVRSIQKVSWHQGRPPFKVTLTRDDGIIELAVPKTEVREITFPELARGHTYTLRVKDDSGSEGHEEFYILSSEQDRQLREDRRELLSGLSNRQESLIAQVAFFEARGLLFEALPLAEEAAQRSTEDPGVWLALGRIQLQLGLDGKAEKSLNQAISLESSRSSR